jgi:hypothetical protein
MAAKEDIPRRKRPRLTERVTLSVDPEWLRGLIRRELPLLKKRA